MYPLLTFRLLFVHHLRLSDVAVSRKKSLSVPEPHSFVSLRNRGLQVRILPGVQSLARPTQEEPYFPVPGVFLAPLVAVALEPDQHLWLVLSPPPVPPSPGCRLPGRNPAVHTQAPSDRPRGFLRLLKPRLTCTRFRVRDKPRIGKKATISTRKRQVSSQGYWLLCRGM